MSTAPSVPPIGDPTFRWAHVAPALGLRIEHLRKLIDRLEIDFEPRNWGYRQLSDITDEIDRTVISDQIRGAADAVATNLFEVRLHEQDYNDLIGVEGLRVPTDVESAIARSRLDMHLTGFFQAFGSTLDCVAATAIGILRVPRSIHRADFNHLAVLALFSQEAQAVAADQRAAWDRLRALLDNHRAGPPQDWLDWSLELRNALLHRAKNFMLMFNRPRQSQIEVVSENDEFPWWLVRFDPNLSKRPWLPDMAMFPTADTITDAVIAEPSSTTLRGLAMALNDLVEAATALLLELWDAADTGALQLPAPTAAWRASFNPNQLAFEGFAPGPIRATELRVSSGDADRLALASAVRRRILGHP